MTPKQPLAMVRCHLDDSDDSSNRRYVPAFEFELWRHFMATQHGRPVTVDEVSVWLPENPEMLDEDIDPETLEPVLRVRFEKPASPGSGPIVPVVRFLPIETYPVAKEALLGHFDERCQNSLEETPGYFVTAGERHDTGPAHDLAFPAPAQHANAFQDVQLNIPCER
jgi:hypothetical protein